MNIKKNKNSRFPYNYKLHQIICYIIIFIIIYYNVIKYKNILYRQINLNKN